MLLPMLIDTVTILLANQTPSVVKVSHQGPGFELTVNGKPFLVKGAGGDGSKSMLAAAGANSFRTWGSDNLDAQLDEAQKLGLKVTVGIWLGHEEQGFSYNDPQAVEDQFQKAKAAILKYKNHPAVLMWGIGNEMEGYAAGDNPKIWRAVEDIAHEAKKQDPNHPTMTVIAEIGGKKVPSINTYCPDIDIVGINSYGGVASLPTRYKEAGGVKPYIVTEFGPPGVWESAKNAWGAVPELTSTEKAAIYKTGYEKAVLGAPGLCLGSYAFTWGNKQEATATWFGMLLADGSRLGAIDAMTEEWSGKPPANRCPIIESLSVDGATDVKPGATVNATLKVTDPDGDPLKVDWVLQREASAYGNNGANESKPPIYPNAILESKLHSAQVQMPTEAAGYRLFAFIHDDHGNAAVGNVPLHVHSSARPNTSRHVELPFYLYQDSGQPIPYAPSGWMGDTGSLQLDVANTEQPHSGSTCVKVDFTKSSGWAGIAWQSPANDWGDKPGGYDLTGATKLTFWARGDHGGESIAVGVGLIGSEKAYPDSLKASKPDVVLTQDWKQYSIDLAGRNLEHVKTGFVITLVSKGSPITVYLDDIRYE
jgi:hypothetical protein